MRQGIRWIQGLVLDRVSGLILDQVPTLTAVLYLFNLDILCRGSMFDRTILIKSTDNWMEACQSWTCSQGLYVFGKHGMWVTFTWSYLYIYWTEDVNTAVTLLRTVGCNWDGRGSDPDLYVCLKQVHMWPNVGYGDLVRYRKIGSNTIIKGNIEENVSIMPILPAIVTFVKFSEENSEWMINKKILIANALWEMIQGIVINPWILRIYIVAMLPWLQKMEIWGFENIFSRNEWSHCCWFKH